MQTTTTSAAPVLGMVHAMHTNRPETKASIPLKHPCAYCEKDVIPTARRVGREVTGWEQVREQGGANSIIARRETGRYACERCLGMVRQGLNPREQGAMF
jgi:hypothetical protein